MGGIPRTSGSRPRLSWVLAPELPSTVFSHGAGPTIGSSHAVAMSWVSQARTTSSAPAAAAMFASSAIPASASWPT